MSDRNEQAQGAPHGPDIDKISGVATTGHEWDGLKELNNPLPKWWVYTFYGCIVWAIAYTFFYPAWPLISTHTKGLLGHTNRGALEEELASVKAGQAVYLEKIAAAPLADIAKDPELYAFALRGGQANFATFCIQCHGSGAQGGPGYPNLSDDDWLWGGDLDAIHTTIAHGVRNETDPDARTSMMSAFGADALLKKEEIAAVADHVLSLSDAAAPKSEAGAQLFADNCAACHGEDAKGNRDMGAPNLTDGIWLYGGAREQLVAQISKPRHGVMPAWGGRLGDAAVKQLALYVHSLGGGEGAAK